MAIPTGAILKAVASIVLPDLVIAQNVFNVLFENDGTGNDDVDVVSDIADWIDDIFTEVDGQIDSEANPSDVKVYIWDSIDTDWDEIGSESLTYVPGRVDQMLPHGVAALIYARTEDPDVMGLKYLPGFTEIAQDASSWAAGPLAEMLLAADQWTTDHVGAATGSTFTPGVWSTAQEDFKTMSGVYGVKGNAAYQRRRKPGVGI